MLVWAQLTERSSLPRVSVCLELKKEQRFECFLEYEAEGVGEEHEI